MNQNRFSKATALLVAIIAIVLILTIVSCVMPAIQPGTPQPEAVTTAAIAPENTAETTTVTNTTEVTGTTDSTPTDTTAVTETTTLTATDTATATGATTTTGAAALAPEGTYKDIPVGFTEDGYPYRGEPDAPITLYEYSDYQCPFCSRYFVQTEPAIDESYVRSGQVRVVFRDFPLAELHPNAPPAHVAANCVADQGAEAYWQMHGLLFQTQSAWNSLADPMSYFTELATQTGVDMTVFNSCVQSGEKDAVVAAGIAEARAKGFSGTPSFEFVRSATDEAFPLVGAQPYDQFSAMLDTLIAGGTPQTEQAQEGSDEIPFWATAEGLAPDPERPQYTMAGDFHRGNPDAKVTVIEFSDFQCPYCRKHTQETQPVLDEKFVDTDQVYWVFKHFPLSIHPQAPAAGVAAECAADQGQFWEMHERLFNTIPDWSINEPNPIFAGLAGELGLDVDKFTTCLTEPAANERVQEDLAAGTAFVRGTPTFIVLYDGQGSIIPGALPADRFSEILQQVIDGTVQPQ